MSAPQSRINDFVLKIGTVNGTGSASANGLLMKALFRMGVPVTGKNMFPSNIQGLPTWYEIRASKDGYMARSGRVDVMVAMNAQTYKQDLAEVSPGGFLLYDSTWPREHTLQREDITVLGVPLAKLANENFSVARIRILMKNVAYVGALAALLDIDLDIIRDLLKETFASKPRLVDTPGADVPLSAVTPRAAFIFSPSSSCSKAPSAGGAWPLAPGIRSRHLPRSWTRSKVIATCSALTRKPASGVSASSRPKTNCPQPVSFWVQTGPARARSRQPPVRASR
jgi:Pyruvate/2-oxoacid:ferredoxin oxidoreductase gamma subunit